jgi:PTS system mannose-specific IIA component
MIGICIITHGELANGLKDSCELIIGEQLQLYTLGLRHGDDFDEFKESVLNGIEKVNNNDGVLVFVDLFGASPYNSVLFNLPQLIQKNITIRMISGVNLPMLIEACDQRNHMDLDAVFMKVIRTGKDYIIGIDDQLNQII